MSETDLLNVHELVSIFNEFYSENFYGRVMAFDAEYLKQRVCSKCLFFNFRMHIIQFFFHSMVEEMY
jgi:hypothetical protein